jgi:predicted nuclease of predicted toxin-antitoxin system
VIFWVDAQLPPSLAPWLTERFGVEASSMRFLGLRDAEDLEIFERLFVDAIALLHAGESIVELGDA